MSKEKKSESKMWLLADHQGVYTNEAPTVSEPVKILLETYQPSDTLPSRSVVPMGIVYEHEYHEDELARGLRYHAIPLMGYSEVNAILGKILTFVDATYTDKEQREATKKILRTTIWEYNNYLQEQITNGMKRAKEQKTIN